MKTLPLDKINESILAVRGEKVILDSDVAGLYNVETKRINEAVKNNPGKFPEGYILKLTKEELNYLRSIISSTKLSKTRSIPLAFTEKGLYMLATILKSKVATQTTIAIIETFAKIRELSSTIRELSVVEEPATKNNLVRKSGELLSDIIDKDMKVTDTETSVEINFAIVKFKHLAKRGKEKK